MNKVIAITISMDKERNSVFIHRVKYYCKLYNNVSKTRIELIMYYMLNKLGEDK